MIIQVSIPNPEDDFTASFKFVTRPAVSTQRLSLTRQGDIRYTLKAPYRDGTTHVIFEPLDFIPQGTLS